MKSKTKYNLTNDKIKQLFSHHNISDIKTIKPLGNGMFNAVYCVKTSDTEYVLKVSPKSGLPVMTYEQNMLKTELYWYNAIEKNTCVATPKIHFSSFDKETVDSYYFAMEKCNGVERNKSKLNDVDKNRLSMEIIAQFHNVKNDKFGYVQNELYDNWYLALRNMTLNIINDAKAMNKTTKRGKMLLNYIDKYKNILENCECTMVNYDLWDTNVICNGDKFSVIDPERSFWGDPIFDFICFGDFFEPLKDKKNLIELHNSLSDTKIEINEESEIRYAFAQGLMALIQEVEKYYRFNLFSEGWMFDTISANKLYRQAFKVLKNE